MNGAFIKEIIICNKNVCTCDNDGDFACWVELSSSVGWWTLTFLAAGG